MILMVGLVTFVLHAGVGSTTTDNGSAQVRMEVDPTVLPAVQELGQSAPEKPFDTTEATPEAEPEEALATEQAAKPEVEQTQQAPVTIPEPAEKTATPTKPTPEPVIKEAPQGVGSVQAIAIDSTDSNFTLTVTCDRPVGDTTYMNLDNPKRLVIDLREPLKLRTKNVVRVSSGAVKHVVVGSHPDRLRLVIHFQIAPKGRIEPTFERSGDTLVVTGVMP